MPQLNRKRRAPTEDESDSSSSPPPRRTQLQASQRRRASATPPSTGASTPDPTTDPTDTISTQTKLLLRLALSTESSRIPLRRADINAKCGTSASTFRRVFDDAQYALRNVWGMHLVELPGREKTGLRERQAAAAAATQAAATQAAQTQPGTQAGPNKSGGGGGDKAWILVSTLPAAMRRALGDVDAGISGSSSLHATSGSGSTSSSTQNTEASYTALTSFIITLITLSGGTLAEAKLDRHLRRVNAATSTPVDATERVLARMVREGYVAKTREGGAGDEFFEYRVGPRGKVEVGEKGVAGLVRGVYEGAAGGAEMGETEAEELEGRIERSLKVGGGWTVGAGAGEASEVVNGTAVIGGRGRGRPRRAREEDDED